MGMLSGSRSWHSDGMALRLLLASAAQSRALFQLDAPSRGPQPPPGTWPMALYPLPAVYLPNSQCMLRNIEPRNLAMCREQTHFVSACVTSDSSCCASVGSVLRIDDVRPAASDTSGMVLADPMSSNVLEVRCTVVGRVQLVACQNLEVWRRPQRDYYLMADVAAYDDEVGQASDMSPEAGGEVDDVPDAIYRLVDALTQSSSSADSTDGGLDTDAAVAALEKAATHAEDGEWWEALEIWQTHCATRLAAETTLHRAERNEYVIDAKLRQGGALKIPVEEWTLDPSDRQKLDEMDRRAADATAQMQLDDTATFQACLESRRQEDRALILLRGVQRETDRLNRRAALKRALDKS